MELAPLLDGDDVLVVEVDAVAEVNTGDDDFVLVCNGA
jgi:hypothetical protein